MSLYNALFGVNPLSAVYMTMLGLTSGDVGRFRDCYLQKNVHGDLRIVIFTRNGGGNRDDYAGTTESLQAHPEYVEDFDDEFDSTYASYVFKVPEKFKVMAEQFASEQGEVKEPMARFKDLLDKMQNHKDDDPEVQRALEIGKKILEPAIAKLNEEAK
jgi:hypothetical protein